MRMNGLHESNSKLNIRSYPEAKKTDSDLILLLCPLALCSRLSTFETHKPPSVYSTTKVRSSFGDCPLLFLHTCPVFSMFFF